MSKAIINTVTGEVIDLAQPTPALSDTLGQVAEMMTVLTEIRKVITDELLTRQDGEASWTWVTDQYKLSSTSPAAAVAYDVETLRDQLLELTTRGELSEEAYKRCFKIELKPVVSQINAVAKTSGQAAAAVEKAKVETPKRRSIKVERVKSLNTKNYTQTEQIKEG